jgi:hypothetical protein
MQLISGARETRICELLQATGMLLASKANHLISDVALKMEQPVDDAVYTPCKLEVAVVM